ncbi:MAG: four helix bundle protein [Gemmatimonadaceae bacterium]
MTLREEYRAWLRMLPHEITSDAIWTCTAYRLATFASDRLWEDLSRLTADPRTIAIADQLGRALRGIGAAYTEGYSRRSSRDRCRYYEYSLGSAREARDWVFKGRRVIGLERANETLFLLGRIIRLLTVTIVRARPRDPRKRG